MKKRLPFYICLLPLLWGVRSYIHRSYPGDENAMWLISSAAGLWIAPLVFFAHASKVMIAVYIAIAGAMVMMGVGFAMDFFGVRKTLWIILFPTCTIGVFVLSIMSYSSIERAISKNGSWWDYILFSINVGIYISVVLSVIVTAIGWLCNLRTEQ